MPRRKRPPEPDALTERIRRHLLTLGLNYTAEHLEQHLAGAADNSQAPSQWLESILAEEAAYKTERRIERRVRLSRLREHKTLEAFDWNFQPGLDKPLILELARLDFVRRAEDLIITGKSGTGKSHILQAFALRACQQQLRTRYTRCVDMLDDLYAGLADGSYAQRLKRWCAPTLLVIDDVGLGQVKQRADEPTAAHTLFNVIDRRHGKASTALTSNIRLSRWGKYLGDATLAAAILDRLAMRAIRIDIDGPSYRQKTARDLAEQHGTKSLDDSQAPNDQP